jgi:hypothetical protein
VKTEKGFTVGIRIRIRNPEADEVIMPTDHWVIP